MSEIFVYVLLEKLASSVLQEISLPWGLNGELKKLKETISTIEAVLPVAEEMQKNKAALRIWLTKLEVVFLNARSLLHDVECEVQLRSQLVFRSRICHRIKKMRESIDEIAAERNVEAK
ncbi:hypothetical protein UlMin_016827 [Ulmus minor]